MPALRSGRCDAMNEADIRKYAQLMKELGLTALEITEDQRKLSLECSAPVSAGEHARSAPSPEPVPQAAGESADQISVKSPIVGVFYAAPAENAAPYVTVGDRVVKGQTLCIIEAMKLMNEITAEEDGVISEVCVTNGQVVEYGTELFRIKR